MLNATTCGIVDKMREISESDKRLPAFFSIKRSTPECRPRRLIVRPDVEETGLESCSRTTFTSGHELLLACLARPVDF
jgi:hypothetical protein